MFPKKIHLGVWNEDLTKEVWAAANLRVHGRFLVTFDLGFGGVDVAIADKYKAALFALSTDARGRQDLSEHVWLFARNSTLVEMFQTLVDHLGLENHNYSVIELTSGEGLGYNAKRRIVYEIEACEGDTC